MAKPKIAKAWEAARYTRVTLGKITELARAEKALVVNGVTQETE
jgi:hypothetical protein